MSLKVRKNSKKERNETTTEKEKCSTPPLHSRQAPALCSGQRQKALNVPQHERRVVELRSPHPRERAYSRAPSEEEGGAGPKPDRSPSQKKPLSFSSPPPSASLSSSSIGGRPLAQPAAREGRSPVKKARRSGAREEEEEEGRRAEAKEEAAVFFFFFFNLLFIFEVEVDESSSNEQTKGAGLASSMSLCTTTRNH